MKIPFYIDPGIYMYQIELEEDEVVPKHFTEEPRSAREIFLQEVKNQ